MEEKELYTKVNLAAWWKWGFSVCVVGGSLIACSILKATYSNLMFLSVVVLTEVLNIISLTHLLKNV